MARAQGRVSHGPAFHGEVEDQGRRAIRLIDTERRPAKAKVAGSKPGVPLQIARIPLG